VNWKDNIHRVDEIYTDEVKVTSIEDGGCFPRMIMGSCNPIPLTPEWLERCGFEKAGDAFDIKTQFGAIRHMFNKIILFFGSEYQLSVSMDYDVMTLPCQCEHLHQLQNLYIALTGEELNVKI
jgi:hypothetical protein